MSLHHGIVVSVPDDHAENRDSSESRSAWVGDGDRDQVLFGLLAIKCDASYQRVTWGQTISKGVFVKEKRNSATNCIFFIMESIIP